MSSKIRIITVEVRGKLVVRIDFADGTFKLFWANDFERIVRESNLDFNPLRKNE